MFSTKCILLFMKNYTFVRKTNGPRATKCLPDNINSLVSLGQYKDVVRYFTYKSCFIHCHAVISQYTYYINYTSPCVHRDEFYLNTRQSIQ